MVEIVRIFAEVLLPILLAVALGYTFRRKIPFDLPSINRLCMYVLSPCLVFNTLLRANLNGGDTLRMITFVIVSTLAMGVVSLVVGRWLKLDRTDQSAFLLTTMFMNSGNYGLPLARFAFGEAGFQYAILFYLGQTTMAQTLAVFIAAAGRADMRQALLQVLRLPLVYAAAGALLLRWIIGSPSPETPFVLVGLERGIELIAGAALPVLLLMLGMQLGAAPAVEDGRRVTIATALRLVVAAPPRLRHRLAARLRPHRNQCRRHPSQHAHRRKRHDSRHRIQCPPPVRQQRRRRLNPCQPPEPDHLIGTDAMISMGRFVDFKSFVIGLTQLNSFTDIACGSKELSSLVFRILRS